jgi:hypothetical protein
LQTLIAHELARWHTTHVPELPQEPSLFPRMKHWAKCAKEFTQSFSWTIGDRKYDWKDLDEEVDFCFVWLLLFLFLVARF